MPFGWVAAAGALSGYLGSEASGDAGAAGAAATNRGIDVQYQMYNNMRGDLDPYRKAGLPALARLMHLSGLGVAPSMIGERSGIPAPTRQEAAKEYIASQYPGANVDAFGWVEADESPSQKSAVDAIMARKQSEYDAKIKEAGAKDPLFDSGSFGSLLRKFSKNDFEAEPGYNFRREEGEKALSRGAAARGLSASTPGLRALMRFNQDYASNEFGAAYGRFEGNKAGKFNMLSYLAGTGQNAAANLGAAGVNTGAGISQAAIAGGQFQANAAMGSASAWNNAIQGGMSNYMYQDRWNQQMARYDALFSNRGGGRQNWNNTGDWNSSNVA